MQRGTPVTKSRITIEYCNCMVEDFPFWTAKCGCGETHARLYRDQVIHWLGQHWVLECAFKHAARFVPEQKASTKRSAKHERPKQTGSDPVRRRVSKSNAKIGSLRKKKD